MLIRAAAIVIATLAAGIGLCENASASTIVVGPLLYGTIQPSNCYPFTCFNGSEYQQVYSSAAFSAATPIYDIVFYEENIGPAEAGTYTISMSYTSKAVGGLSTNLADNIGANNTTVFGGSLPAITGGELVLPFTTAFAYDPSLGNLLLTVGVSGNNATSWTGTFKTGGTMSSRAYDSSAGTVFADSIALVTGFVTTPGTAVVPLPAALPLFTSALGGAGFFGWRKKRKRKAIVC